MAGVKAHEDAEKKPALSSRLMQMKFMQRGKEKTVLKEAVAEQVCHHLSPLSVASDAINIQAKEWHISICTYQKLF